MSNFEKEKEEFLEYVRKDEDILESIVNNNMNNPEGQKTLGIMFNPSNEKELLVSKTLYAMSSASLKLVNAAYFDEIEEIPFEENEGLKNTIKTIMKLKNGEELERTFSTKDAAKYCYQYFVVLLTDMEEAMEYIAKETGFDLEDPIEGVQFSSYLDKVKEFNEGGKNLSDKKDLESVSMEKLNTSYEFALEFKRLAEEGINNHKKQEEAKKLNKSKKISF